MKNQYSHNKFSLDGWWTYIVNDNKSRIILSHELVSFYKENGLKEVDTLEKFLSLIHPEDIDEIKGIFQNIMSNESLKPKVEFRVLSEDKKIYWLLAKFETRKDSVNTFKIDVTQTDITLLKNNELQLERSNKEFEQFAYVISHDLQSPIRQIWTYCEILENKIAKEGSDSNLLTYLQRIQTTSKHMKGLTQDLLELCKIGQSHLSFSKLSPKKVIENASLFLKEKIDNSLAKIDVSKDIPSEMIANEMYFTDIFVNLISNSIKYKKSDIPPEMTIQYLEKTGFHIFTFKDNGIGIKPENQKKVFQIFKRGSTEKVLDIKGVGIGLATVKKIIEIHGGYIEIDPHYTNGLSITFSIPIHLK